MKPFKEFTREHRVTRTRTSNVRESVEAPDKAFIIDSKRGYKKLDRPLNNYVLVGTVDGELSELFNSLYGLIKKHRTRLMQDVIFCDDDGSKIQIWVNKDTINELNHVRVGVEKYAEMLADRMMEDESTPALRESEYENVWDILNTFEATNEDGQKWYDFEHTFWDKIEDFFFE